LARWRNIKHKKQPSNTSSSIQTDKDTPKCAPLVNRLKTFLIDMFMIMMPIMYLTTYVVMEGKDDFQGSEIARWITAALYGVIIISFWYFKGQTPGLKAYDYKLIDSSTKGNLSLIKCLIRYLVFIFAAMSIVGAFVPLFRKDKKTLQDLAVNSCIINISKTK
jgi:uncharacterized RDD family membrane protein YckC